MTSSISGDASLLLAQGISSVPNLFDEVTTHRNELFTTNRWLQRPFEEHLGSYRCTDGQCEPYFSSYIYLLLWTAGCNGNDCLRECTSEEHLFSSAETKWNCLSLAALSLRVRSWENPLAANDVDTSLRLENAQIIDAFLQPFGMNYQSVNSSDHSDALSVLNKTYQCAEASCRQWEGSGTCSMSFPDEEDIYDAEAWSNALVKVCDELPPINPDLAGPGVLLSVLMQSCIALSVFYLIPIMYMYKRSHRTALESIMHSTQTFLVEFQEAQCFFSIAIQLATLYAMSQDTDISGTVTEGLVSATRITTQVLAELSISVTLLMQSAIDYTRMTSVYSQLLASIAFGLATATKMWSQKPGNVGAFSGDSTFLGRQDGIQECGGHFSLRIQCADDSDLRTVHHALEPTITWSVPVHLGLLMLLWWHEIGRCIRWLHGRDNAQPRVCISTSTENKLRKLRWRSRLSLKVLRGTFEAFVWVTAFVHSLGLGKRISNMDLASGSEEAGDDYVWNVGQIVAITVWVPVVSKLVYMLLFGVEPGFRVRLSREFEILRKTPIAAPKVPKEPGIELRSRTL